MLFNRNKEFNDLNTAFDINYLVFLTKKLLPELVFNIGNLEGNAFTYPQVQTLLEGITVGGHKVSDEQEIFKIRDGWNKVITKVIEKDFIICKEEFNSINSIVSKNETIMCGSFRTGQVKVAGTNFIPPKAEDLEEIFSKELAIIINRCTSNINLAFELFLWATLNKFYYNANTRTALLIANIILISSGQGFINIKNKHKIEFYRLIIDFYNTKEADNIMNFLYYKCLER